MRDDAAKTILLEGWRTTTTIWSGGRRGLWWLRAQPQAESERARAPRLNVPGSDLFATQPDGLWMSLGILRGDTNAVAAFADCVVVEVCGTAQNLNDKRARYAARTTSLVLSVGQSWLDQRVRLQGQGGTEPQRRDVLGGQLPSDTDIRLPVRHLRVLYALPDGPRPLYERARDSMVFEAHEFVCPQRMLGQWSGQPMQRFLKRMAPGCQFAR